MATSIPSTSTSTGLSLTQALALGAVASAVTAGSFYYLVVKPQTQLQAAYPLPAQLPRERALYDDENSKKETKRAVSMISLRATKDTNYWPDTSNMTPAQIFDFLLERNKQFVDGYFFVPDLSAKRRRTVADKGQFPPVAIVACSDARVPPEYVFGAGVGDLFLVRSAGSSIDRVGLGSLEYAVQYLGIKLILVIGHSQCGAVTTALNYAKKELAQHPYDPTAGPSVQRTADNSIWSLVESCLIPAIETIKDADPEACENTNVEEAVARNAKHQANVIFTNSKILRNALREKKIAIRCARSFIRTGQVFEVSHRPVKDPRAVLATPSPLFTDPKDVVLQDD